MTRRNNIVLHSERSFKKLKARFNNFVAAGINKTQTKKQWFFYNQILVILPKYRIFSLIQNYNSAYLFS